MPFVVWTDHKNLAYLRSAKRLNFRQARWALFLGCFNFVLTYRPGSKNTKLDALSHQFTPDQLDQDPSPILPPTCIVVFATWQIEERVREALRSSPAPGEHLQTLSSREAARSEVLQWGHSSKLVCHPRVNHTLHLLRQRFWWLSIARITKAIIAACPVCARGKSSHQPPCRSPSPAVDPTLSLAPHRGGFCHRSPAFRGTQ